MLSMSERWLVVRHWLGIHTLVDVWDSKTHGIVGKSCWLCPYREP